MLIEAALLPRNFKNKGNQIPVNNFMPCLWQLLWFHFFTVQLRFIRFRFRNNVD